MGGNHLIGGRAGPGWKMSCFVLKRKSPVKIENKQLYIRVQFFCHQAVMPLHLRRVFITAILPFGYMAKLVRLSNTYPNRRSIISIKFCQAKYQKHKLIQLPICKIVKWPNSKMTKKVIHLIFTSVKAICNLFRHCCLNRINLCHCQELTPAISLAWGQSNQGN